MKYILSNEGMSHDVKWPFDKQKTNDGEKISSVSACLDVQADMGQYYALRPLFTEHGSFIYH